MKIFIQLLIIYLILISIQQLKTQKINTIMKAVKRKKTKKKTLIANIVVPKGILLIINLIIIHLYQV